MKCKTDDADRYSCALQDARQHAAQMMMLVGIGRRPAHFFLAGDNGCDGYNGVVTVWSARRLLMPIYADHEVS